jgi:hypothetical protein
MEITEAELNALKAKAAEAETLKSKADAADDFKKDMLKYKEEATTLRKAREDEEKKSLVEREQYKQLYEKSEAEKAVFAEKAEKAVTVVDTYIKRSAVETAALAAGLRKEALPDLKLLGLEKLEARKDGNEVTVTGVEDFVTEQKRLRPHWFTPKDMKINDPKGGGGGGSGKELTAKELVELEKKDKDAYQAVMKERMAAKKA